MSRKLFSQQNRTIPHLILGGVVVFGISFSPGGNVNPFRQESTPTVEFTLTATTIATESIATESPIATSTPEAVTASPTLQSEAKTSTSTSTPDQDPYIQKARILVQISKNANYSKVADSLTDLSYALCEDMACNEVGKIGVLVLEVPSNQVEAIKNKILQSVSGVGYVEEEIPISATDIIPNDPDYPNQYALNNIRAPQGWEYSTGSSAVTIAIVDSGVALDHIDFAGKLTAGYDFFNNDSNPYDDNGHGTHVAGIAAATGNNGVGVAGVSWGARIMPVKVLGSNGLGTSTFVAAGIIWATDHGAQIINLSLGTSQDTVILQNAVQYAYNKGVLQIASSGNNNGNLVLYPARYSEVMAVGATNSADQPMASSNYGNELEIAAPGEFIYSSWPGGYNVLSGTSMAAPFVSGLAAILFGYTNNAAVVRNIIEGSAKDIPPAGWDMYTGAGLIQMDAAIQQLAPPLPTKTPARGDSGPSGSSFYPLLLQTNTHSPLSSPTPASPIDTPTGTLTPVLLPSMTPTNTPTAATPLAQPVQSSTHENWILPCTGLIMIFAGIFLFWTAKSREKHRRFK